MSGAEPREPLLPRGVRWAGPALSAMYGTGVKINRAIARKKAAPVATICIGNMTVGGTGKTPATIYFTRELARRGRRPAILMRGYKAQGGDEAEEVKAALAGLNVPVLLGGNRYSSALKAIDLGCDVVLLDDGFQHWRLARDLDVVLIDATDAFGGGRVLPHGRLREPVEGLARAGAIVITRADSFANADARRDLLRELARLAPNVPVLCARHAPVGVRALGAQEEWSLPRLKGLSAVAACGIGNPDAFWTTLQNAGINVLDRKAFPDHHAFNAGELARLGDWAREKKAGALLVTEKDAVKIATLPLPKNATILSLRVEFQVDGAEALWKVVDAALLAGDLRCRSS